MLKRTLRMSDRLRVLGLEGTSLPLDLERVRLCARILDLSRELRRLTEEEIHRHQSRGDWI